MKKALAVGELDSDLKDDVMFEMLKFIANDDCCKNELEEDQLRDAADYAFNVFLVSWRNIVKKVNNEDEFYGRLKNICLSACQTVQMQQTHDRTMGVVDL